MRRKWPKRRIGHRRSSCCRIAGRLMRESLPTALFSPFKLRTDTGEKRNAYTHFQIHFFFFLSLLFPYLLEQNEGEHRRNNNKKTRDRRGYVHMHRVSSISWSAVSTSVNSERRNRVTWKKQKNKNTNKTTTTTKKKDNKALKKREKKQQQGKNNMRKKHRGKILKNRKRSGT